LSLPIAHWLANAHRLANAQSDVQQLLAAARSSQPAVIFMFCAPSDPGQNRTCRQLLAAACKAAGGAEGCYEMTAVHPDKGQLPLEEVQRRLRPFIDDGTPIVLTRVGLRT